ncbi:hypothetical protein AcV5_006372 [Taiwanofungus camphoratus]|nr:hypothetical protein AcV5_006372 [Antrodia cinnamomea]
MSKLSLLGIGGVNWCNRTRPHLSFFHLIGCFTSVTLLDLTDCKFPTFCDVRRLICGLPRLSSLAYQLSAVESDGLGARYPVLARPRLLELHLASICAGELIEWCHFLNASASARTIQKLYLDYLQSEDQGTDHLVSAVDSLLKSLGDVLSQLIVPVHVQGGDQWNLEYNRRLQSLAVSWTVVTPLQWPNYWNGVARLLSHVTSDHLQQLSFRITFKENSSTQQRLSDAGDTDTRLPIEDTVDWDHLNDVITRECFDKMEAVYVWFGNAILYPISQQVLDDAKSQLYRTAWHARGILKIDDNWWLKRSVKGYRLR